MRGPRWITVAALAAAAVSVAGCGGGNQRPHPEVTETVRYGSVGNTAQLDCGAGKSLDVAGSNNTLRVAGACWSVRVGGADNKVTLDRIDGDLSVTGLNNTIVYRSGDPAVSDAGTGNRISRG